jgi:hypothetical protein
MITIKLDSGIEVKVNGFEFGYTYGGVIEGIPNMTRNIEIYESANYPANWGTRKTIKIKPEKSELKKKLRPAHYSVWLTSFEALNPKYDGSELVVIWFADLPNGKTVEEIIENGIRSIDWKKNAHDFHF